MKSILPLLLVAGLTAGLAACADVSSIPCPPPAELTPLCNQAVSYSEAFVVELADQVAGLPAGSPAPRAIGDYMRMHTTVMALCTLKAKVLAPSLPANPPAE